MSKERISRKGIREFACESSEGEYRFRVDASDVKRATISVWKRGSRKKVVAMLSDLISPIANVGKSSHRPVTIEQEEAAGQQVMSFAKSSVPKHLEEP